MSDQLGITPLPVRFPKGKRIGFNAPALTAAKGSKDVKKKDLVEDVSREGSNASKWKQSEKEDEITL